MLVDRELLVQKVVILRIDYWSRRLDLLAWQPFHAFFISCSDITRNKVLKVPSK